MKKSIQMTLVWAFKMKYIFFVFLSFYGLMSSHGFASTTEHLLENSNSPSLNTTPPFISGETLYYKLSYRGLLTSMIWADLADVRMTYISGKKTPQQHDAYQFELFLSTENYSKAEIFQPVRYTYTTTLDASLQRTVLVEEVDNGKNQSHDFLWLDWVGDETQLFKKREKIQEKSGFFGMDTKEVWEQDGQLQVPLFLGEFPLLSEQKSYLIHKESGDKIKYSQILDPLSLIYNLRIQDFNEEEIKEIAIAVSDDIRIYHVKKMLQEEISVNGQTYSGIKYKIQTDEKKDNYYYVWLSNDNKRVPLRLAMDAPLGKLEIDLMKITP